MVACAGLIADAIVPVLGGALVAMLSPELQIIANMLIEKYAQRSISSGAGAVNSYFMGPHEKYYRSFQTGHWLDFLYSSYTPPRPPSFQNEENQNREERKGLFGSTYVTNCYAGLGVAVDYGGYDFHAKHILFNGQGISVPGAGDDHTLEGRR